MMWRVCTAEKDDSAGTNGIKAADFLKALAHGRHPNRCQFLGIGIDGRPERDVL